MHQDKPQEIVIITSKDGVWREEKLSFAQEKAYSPWQWKRVFKEKMSPGYQSSMEELRRADDSIARFSDELSYLLKLLPSDPVKLPDISLILIEIKQRLDSIVEAGKQVEPAKNKKLQDFYGRFHVKIPESLRTASDENGGKIATAGLIGDFIHWVGRKIFELTDVEIREMKRVVTHLLNTTKQTVKSINKTLDDMRSARKTGDIDKYIEGVKFIAKEQGDFRNEFSMVYDSYLKEPYEHALALEAEAKREAEARGEEFKPSHEEVSVDEQGKINVIEVDPPPPGEASPLDVAEDAEEAPKTPEEVSEERRLQMLKGLEEPPESLEPPTIQDAGAEAGHQRDIERRHEKYLQQRQSLQELGPRDEPMVDWWRGKERIPSVEVEIPSSWSEAKPLSPQKELQPVQWYGKTKQSPGVSPPSPESAPDVRLQEVGGPSSEPKVKPPPSIEEASQVGVIPSYYASQIEGAITKVAHARFLSELGKIAETENKHIVAAFMAKYSEELEDSNPQASAALLRAAQEILND